VQREFAARFDQRKFSLRRCGQIIDDIADDFFERNGRRGDRTSVGRIAVTYAVKAALVGRRVVRF
jgi:hypothetical protein